MNRTFCVFAGTAINWGRSYALDIDTWLKNYSIPTLYIQKTSDPAISYADLTKLLSDSNVSNATTREIPGTDHNYEDMALLERETKEFVG